ncbi:hypothetical protein GCM10023322_79380 [Rugosimonospora acidiphila]|uniref:DUF4166 domain-containing protein n=1 Tax=Rugosimonospora acidiphila TaxID=556531 RepID=A0ABP9STA9_9ACTN
MTNAFQSAALDLRAPSRHRSATIDGVAGWDESGERAAHGWVVFYRRRGRWYQQRAYFIKLDGVPTVKVRRGQGVSVLVRPGVHTARAGVAATLSRPVEFEAQPDSQVRIRVEYASRFLLGLWRGFTITRWLRLVVEPRTTVATPHDWT